MSTPPTLNPVTVRPIDLSPRDRLGFKIIAVIGHQNDWAAYRGSTDKSDQWVADHGDKISQEVAEALFFAPFVADLKYRL